MNMGVHLINNILSEDDFEWVNQKSLSVLSSGSDMVENYGWKHYIKEFSKPVLLHRIFGEDFNKIDLMLRSTNISPLNKGVIKGCMFYYWNPGSYIPWHTDGNHSGGLTIHLNDDWEFRMGGLFLYNVEDEVKTVVPKKNLGVLQVGGMPHSTTIISENSPVRRTLQIFFDKFNDEPNNLI